MIEKALRTKLILLGAIMGAVFLAASAPATKRQSRPLENDQEKRDAIQACIDKVDAGFTCTKLIPIPQLERHIPLTKSELREWTALRAEFAPLYRKQEALERRILANHGVRSRDRDLCESAGIVYDGRYIFHTVSKWGDCDDLYNEKLNTGLYRKAGK